MTQSRTSRSQADGEPGGADRDTNGRRVTAAVAWLKAKRDEIGLVALAKLLGVDAANWGKVIEGRRKPPASIFRNAFS